jgi:hypothetical protein
MNRLEGWIFSEQDEASQEFTKRGGVIKCIYEASSKFRIKIEGVWKEVGPEGLAEICEKFEKAGEQIRLTDSIPQTTYIFDRETVFFSLVDLTIPKYNRSDIIVKNENFASLMVTTFNAYWEKGILVADFKKKLNL